MKVEDFRSKKISDLRSLLVEDPGIARKASEHISDSISPTNEKIVAVDDDNNVVGVVTGTDLANRIAQKKPIDAQTLTSEVANRNYVGVELGETISDIISKIGRKPGIDFVVVTDGGKYKGVIFKKRLAEVTEELLA